MAKCYSIATGSLFWWKIPGFKGAAHCCLCLYADDKEALIMPLSGSPISDESLEIHYGQTKFWFSKDIGYAASDKLEWFSFDEFPELKSIKSGWIEQCSAFMWNAILDSAEYDYGSIPWFKIKPWAKHKLGYASKLYQQWCSKA